MVLTRFTVALGVALLVFCGVLLLQGLYNAFGMLVVYAACAAVLAAGLVIILDVLTTKSNE